MPEYRRHKLTELAEYKPLSMFEDSRREYWLKINSEEYLKLSFNHYGDGLHMTGYYRHEWIDAVGLTKKLLIPLSTVQRDALMGRKPKEKANAS